MTKKQLLKALADVDDDEEIGVVDAIGEDCILLSVEVRNEVEPDRYRVVLLADM